MSYLPLGILGWTPDAALAPGLQLIQDRYGRVFGAGNGHRMISPDFHYPFAGTGTVTLEVSYLMLTASSGNINIGVELEILEAGNLTDLLLGTDFQAAQTMVEAVPGAPGLQGLSSIPITNKTNLAAGVTARARVQRVIASDTATGGLFVYNLSLKEV